VTKFQFVVAVGGFVITTTWHSRV